MPVLADGDRSVSARRQEEANMVGRQRVGTNGAAAIASRFFQPMEVAVIFLFGEKAGLPPVPI
jgi:hypothetical protein